MRRLLSLIATVALPLAALAATPVEWLADEYDFGAFNEDDGPVTCDFRFVNHSDQPLTVLAVRTSCGCTTSKPPRHAILPGDTASVSATYNPAGRPGRFSKKVYVDIAGQPRGTLTVKGTVIGSANTLKSRFPVKASPLKLRNSSITMGSARKGSIKSAIFEVYNASQVPAEPQWGPLPTYLKITATQPVIMPGEQMAFSVLFDSFDKDTPYGMINDELLFIPAVGADTVRVDFSAMVEEDFSRLTPEKLKNAPEVKLSDDKVDCGLYDRGDTIVKTVTVTNTGKDPLLIRRVYSADPGVDVTVDQTKVKHGKSAVITLSIDSSKQPADFINAKIQLITNSPSHPVTNIRVVGMPR